MKILLTGATGFLGKHVLALLLAEDRVERIDVVTRSKSSHPDPRVRIVSLDLSDPTVVDSGLADDADLVLHLAGQYHFQASLADNYDDNVLAALNLAALVKQTRRHPLPLVFTSSHVVGFGREQPLDDRPLDAVPSRDFLFPHTKAIAEKIFTDSGLPGAVLRLGVVVGDAQRGLIERITGPYHLLALVRRLRRVPGAGRLKAVPIPIRKGGILPLVPVDCAARVVVAAALRAAAADSTAMPIYEVYNPASVGLERFARAALARLMPWAEPRFVERLPDWTLRLQERLTGIPSNLLDLALRPVPLRAGVNPAFERAFPGLGIPAFESYQDAFFAGFREYLRGPDHAP